MRRTLSDTLTAALVFELEALEHIYQGERLGMPSKPQLAQVKNA